MRRDGSSGGCCIASHIRCIRYTTSRTWKRELLCALYAKGCTWEGRPALQKIHECCKRPNSLNTISRQPCVSHEVMLCAQPRQGSSRQVNHILRLTTLSALLWSSLLHDIKLVDGQVWTCV